VALLFGVALGNFLARQRRHRWRSRRQRGDAASTRRASAHQNENNVSKIAASAAGAAGMFCAAK